MKSLRLPHPGQALPDVWRIAVLRANGIGDLMFALPALEALRATYPAARITLLAAPWHLELLRDRPSPVDEVVVVPLSPGLREEPGVDPDATRLAEFFERMHREEFDLALQMHGGGAHSNPFIARLGAKVTAGLRAPDAPRLDIELPYVYYQSEVMRLLEVASLVGATPLGLEPRLHLTPADQERAAEALAGDRRPLAVLNPGASDPRRRWPTAGFASVGGRLGRAGALIAITGSAADAPLGRAITEAMAEPALDLTGRLDLSGLAGLLARARVVVSNDTGPLHLASAVGAPTVGIYWCGNLINAGPAFRRNHRPVLSWRLECPVCGLDCMRHDCGHDASFVREVPVDEVAAAALELYDAGRDAPWHGGGADGQLQAAG